VILSKPSKRAKEVGKKEWKMERIEEKVNHVVEM